jgi:hypothetical protein
MSTDRKDENRDRTEPNPDITIRHDRLIAVITIAVVSGTVLGACAMFYLLKAHVITSEFDPGPFLLVWAFLVGVWGIGRLLPIKRRREIHARSADPSQAIRDLNRDP